MYTGETPVPRGFRLALCAMTAGVLDRLASPLMREPSDVVTKVMRYGFVAWPSRPCTRARTPVPRGFRLALCTMTAGVLDRLASPPMREPSAVVAKVMRYGFVAWPSRPCTRARTPVPRGFRLALCTMTAGALDGLASPPMREPSAVVTKVMRYGFVEWPSRPCTRARTPVPRGFRLALCAMTAGVLDRLASPPMREPYAVVTGDMRFGVVAWPSRPCTRARTPVPRGFRLALCTMTDGALDGLASPPMREPSAVVTKVMRYGFVAWPSRPCTRARRPCHEDLADSLHNDGRCLGPACAPANAGTICCCNEGDALWICGMAVPAMYTGETPVPRLRGIPCGCLID